MKLLWHTYLLSYLEHHDWFDFAAAQSDDPEAFQDLPFLDVVAAIVESAVADAEHVNVAGYYFEKEQCQAGYY